MPNLPTLPGPDIALRQSDAEQMRRSLKGATTGRAAAMAHRTAEAAGAFRKTGKNGIRTHRKSSAAMTE